jgi:hypothetical protein
MAHFAEVIDGVVARVIVAETAEWCEDNLGGTWVQTSYNTHANTHVLGGTPLHKNYAGIGYTFDGVGFAPPQPYPSWSFNNETYLYDAPTPMPTDGKSYLWNEDNLEWVEVVPPAE